MTEYLPPIFTIAQMTGAIDIDPLLRNCPTCGADELRIEVRDEMYSIHEIARVYRVTEATVREAVNVDAFGRIRAAVPYIHCMNCGGDWDASKEPPQ